MWKLNIKELIVKVIKALYKGIMSATAVENIMRETLWCNFLRTTSAWWQATTANWQTIQIIWNGGHYWQEQLMVNSNGKAKLYINGVKLEEMNSFKYYQICGNHPFQRWQLHSRHQHQDHNSDNDNDQAWQDLAHQCHQVCCQI